MLLTIDINKKIKFNKFKIEKMKLSIDIIFMFSIYYYIENTLKSKKDNIIV